MKVKIKDLHSLQELMNLISKKEIPSFSKEDIAKMIQIVGSTPKEELSRIVNKGTRAEKMIFFYIICNIWTYQAVREFVDNTLK